MGGIRYWSHFSYHSQWRGNSSYNEWRRTKLPINLLWYHLTGFKMFSTWYLHWRGIELLRNDCLFFSKPHPQSPNRKHMYRICRLSNSIHLKNNYLQQGGKGNERVEGVPSLKKHGNKKRMDTWSYIIISFRIPHKSLYIINQSCSCKIKVLLAMSQIQNC